MDAQKQTDKLIRYLKKWCANPNNDLRNNWQKQLRQALADKSPAARRVGSMQLWYWATWHAQHGLLLLLEGDTQGWRRLDLAYRYRCDKMRIDAVMTQVAEPALLLLHALAIDDSERVTWLADYQIKSLRNAQFKLWPFSSLGLLGLELWAQLHAVQDVMVHVHMLPHAPKLGVYKGLWEHGDSSQKLQTSMLAACDYHLQQALSQTAYPEFALSPYNLLPIELFALKRVRAALGASTPEPEHPLLRPQWRIPPESWHCEQVEVDAEVQQFVSMATDQERDR